jgi:putative N6-adenine-specific DNA methylase
MFEFFATAAKGTEGVLRDELRELRLPKVKAQRGGVNFAGTLEDGMRACFETRIAQRILWRRGAFEAPDPESLYSGVRNIDWSDVLDKKSTLAVSANVKNGALRHTGFVALKSKDAIVDQLRERFGSRPDVDRDDPDVHITVHIERDVADVFLDLAGTPLHRRGYRTESREAPLKETLAAAMLRLASWDKQRPLIDPMCGSGTIAIEGYLWAHDVAPGLLRKDFGFMRWRSFDEAQRKTLSMIREGARDRVRKLGPSILALDIERDAVALTQKLAKRAGAELRVERCAVRDFMGTEPAGHIITNPPYGVRLERGDDFETLLARAFGKLRGHRISAICHDPNLANAMQVEPVQEHALWNGDLECRLYSWQL